MPQIWEVTLGTPVGGLPDDVFVDPACGNNGGPPGLPVGSFENFAKRRAESSGALPPCARLPEQARP
jgi:hypothetical protein